MMLVSYITVYLFFVLPTGVYSAGYILSVDDTVDESFRFFKDRSSFQDLQSVKVFQYVYEHKITHQCLKVINFNLIETEDPVDFFMVSCDVKGPFKLEREDSIINVNGLAYLGIKKDYPIWAVYIMPAGKCVQRLYTDKNWNFLELIGEMDLSTEQCSRVIEKGQPLKPRGPKIDVTTITQDKLPPIGQSTTKIIAMDVYDLEHFMRDDSKLDDIEADGQFAKLTVYPVKKDKTGECGRWVSINSIVTEDFLDKVIVSCDDESNKLIIAEDIIEFSGLVYVRDHPNDPIWAVFSINDAETKHCIFKVYTDKERTKLQRSNQNKIEWDVCLKLLESKNIDGLLKIEEENTPEVTIPRKYEDVLKMLKTDLVVSSPPDEAGIDSQLVKPEAEGYQAVPQPAPQAILEKQDFDDEKDSSTTTTRPGEDVPQQSQPGGRFGLEKLHRTFSSNIGLIKGKIGEDPVAAIKSHKAVGNALETFSSNVDLIKEKVSGADSTTTQSSDQDQEQLSKSFVMDYGLVKKKVDGTGSAAVQSSGQEVKPEEKSKEKSEEKGTK